MFQTVELRTLLGIIEKRMLSQLQAMQHEIHGKNWSHTAASCSTKRHRQGENRKMASSSLYLDELLIQKCKFRHRFTVHSLPRKAFPEGLIPPWRSRHESHTCSEISYRITDVECILRAKNTPVNLTGEIGRPYVENSAKYAFYVLAQRNVLMQLCQSWKIKGW